MSHIYVYLCSEENVPVELYTSLILYIILVAAGFCSFKCLFVMIPVAIHTLTALYHAIVRVNPYKYFDGEEYKLR